MDAPLYTDEWLRHEAPSRKDGVTYEVELERRLQCCQLIADVAPELRVYASHSQPQHAVQQFAERGLAKYG
jgi:hypothetical protein